MSVEIPDNYSNPGAGSWRVFGKARASDWQQLAKQQNRVWGDLGINAPGRATRSTTGFWQTTSTTYTQVNDLDQEGLADWCAHMRLGRELGNSDILRLDFAAFLEQCTIEFTVWDITNDAEIDTLELTATTAAWDSATLVLGSSALIGSTPTPLAVYAQAKAAAAQTAKIFCFHTHAYRLTASDAAMLPDGS
mgnify:CR=1 FL=1